MNPLRPPSARGLRVGGRPTCRAVFFRGMGKVLRIVVEGILYLNIRANAYHDTHSSERIGKSGMGITCSAATRAKNMPLAKEA